MNLRHLSLCTALLGALALAACGDTEGGEDSGVTIKDTGTGDTGVITNPDGNVTNPDGSVPDDGGVTTPDGGDGGIPTNRAEGQTCTPDLTNGGPGNCVADLECVPWNAGTTGAMEPLQATCARLGCMSDADCTGAGFGSCAATTIFALDAEQVFFVNYCASSKTKLANETCSVSRRVTQNIDGCADGLSCWVGLFETNRDTGLCAEECERTAEDNNGGCGTERPYCNPLFTITGTASVPGVCQDIQRRPGDICAQQPSGFCDFNSPGDTSCVQIGQDANDPNSFVCLEFCDVTNATECPDSNALGSTSPVSCEDLTPSDNTQNDGLCSIDCSEPFYNGAPDSCIEELGTAVCLRLSTQGGFEGGVCQQVPGPYLDREFLLFDENNQITGVQPNHVNCTPATADNCAPGSFCLALNQAGTDGACATFCLATATGTTASGCELLNDNEVLCVAPIPGLNSTEVGICGKRQ